MDSYLDWAATARPNPKAVEAAARSYTTHFANPSALYSIGTDAHRAWQEAKRSLAGLLSCEPSQLYGCSSGTEANNLVIAPLLLTQSPGSILISAMEHDAVWQPVHHLKQAGWNIIHAPIPPSGILDPDEFLSLIREDTYAVFLMAVCNENGARQPIQAVADGIEALNRRRNRKIKFHVDGVQAFGKFPLSLNTLPVDSLSVSGHKIGAVRGSGLLFLRKPLLPVYLGGGQENGVRSGTENLGALLSLAVAARETLPLWESRLQAALALKRRLITEMIRMEIPLLPLPDPDLLLNPSLYSPFLLQFALPKLPSEVAIRLFSDHRIFLSGGSACSNRDQAKRLRLSKALRLPEALQPSILRLSVGFTTTEAEIDAFLDCLSATVWPLAKQF